MPDDKEEFEIPAEPPEELGEPEEKEPQDSEKVNEVEEIAKAMGWNPNHEGDDALSAKDYILRGQEMLKTSSKHSRNLQRKLDRLEASQEEISKNLQQHFRKLHEASKSKYESKIAELEAKMESAVEDGDMDEYRKARKELRTTEKQAREAEEPDEYTKPKPDPAWEEARADWLEANEWFGVDKEMSDTAEKIYKENAGVLPPDRFFRFLTNKMKEFYPDKFEKKPPKKPKPVAEPTPSAKGKKTYRMSDLTADQRRLVREGCDGTGMKPEQYIKDLVEMGILEG